MQVIMLLKKNYCKWKQWKLGGSKEEYQLAKKPASCALYDVKQHAQSDYFQGINTDNDRKKTFRQLKIPIKRKLQKSVFAMIRGI